MDDPLEAVAEQRAERLPLTYAVDEVKCGPDATRGEIDGDLIAFGPRAREDPLRRMAAAAAWLADGAWMNPPAAPGRGLVRGLRLSTHAYAPRCTPSGTVARLRRSPRVAIDVTHASRR